MSACSEYSRPHGHGQFSLHGSLDVLGFSCLFTWYVLSLGVSLGGGDLILCPFLCSVQILKENNLSFFSLFHFFSCLSFVYFVF